MNPRASAVLPTPSGPDSVITSPAAATCASAAPSSRSLRLALQDHSSPRGIVSVTMVPFPFFDSSSTMPTVRLDELLRQRQPEPERRLAPHAGFGDAVETVEHARQVLRLRCRARCR